MKIVSHRVTRHLVAYQLSILFAAGSAFAQSVWDGGGANSNWSTPQNWATDTAPVSGIATQIQFAGSPASLNSSVDSDFTVRSIVFNTGAGAYVLGGNQISLSGAGADANGIENLSSSTVTINNALRILAPSQIRATGGDLILGGPIDLNGVSAVNFKASAGKTLQINGIVSGSATSTIGFNSGGTIQLNAANTFTTSAINIFNATVVVGVNTSSTLGAFGSGSTPIQMGTSSATAPSLLIGGAHSFSRNVQLVSPSSGVTTATIGGSTAAISTISGTITNGSAGGAAQALTLTAASGGRVNITGNIVRSATGTGSSDNVSKAGAGIVSLSGTGNNYQGATTVSAGTLLVNGSFSAAGGGLSVGTGAYVGGAGTINRASVFGEGSFLTPGDMNVSGASTGGLLTFTNGLSLANTTGLNFDLANPLGLSNDQIAVTGNFVLDGVLNINALSGFGIGTYTLFTYTGGTFTDGGVVLGVTPAGYTYSLDTSTSGLVNLTVVPEPSTVLLALAALGLVSVRWGLKRFHRIRH